ERRPVWLSVDHLEDRTLPSTIAWTNKGNAANDTDGFNRIFGQNADVARGVVQAAIDSWRSVITNFNYSNGSHTFSLTVNAELGDGATGDGRVDLSKLDANGKPMAGSVEIDADHALLGENGGFFLDQTPFDSSEFQGDVMSPYAAKYTEGGPADDLVDL